MGQINTDFTEIIRVIRVLKFCLCEKCQPIFADTRTIPDQRHDFWFYRFLWFASARRLAFGRQANPRIR